MGKAAKWVGIALGIAVALGVGVTIGWFSKPDAETKSADDFDFKLIDNFVNSVDSQKLEEETAYLSGVIRWATSQGKKLFLKKFEFQPN